MNALQVSVYGTLEYTFSLIKILAIIGFLLLAGAILLFSPHAASMGIHLYISDGGFFPSGYAACGPRSSLPSSATSVWR